MFTSLVNEPSRVNGIVGHGGTPRLDSIITTCCSRAKLTIAARTGCAWNPCLAMDGLGSGTQHACMGCTRMASTDKEVTKKRACVRPNRLPRHRHTVRTLHDGDATPIEPRPGDGAFFAEVATRACLWDTTSVKATFFLVFFPPLQIGD